jgi:hypothetical protein
VDSQDRQRFQWYYRHSKTRTANNPVTGATRSSMYWALITGDPSERNEQASSSNWNGPPNPEHLLVLIGGENNSKLEIISSSEDESLKMRTTFTPSDSVSIVA